MVAMHIRTLPHVVIFDIYPLISSYVARGEVENSEKRGVVSRCGVCCGRLYLSLGHSFITALDKFPFFNFQIFWNSHCIYAPFSAKVVSFICKRSLRERECQACQIRHVRNRRLHGRLRLSSCRARSKALLFSKLFELLGEWHTGRLRGRGNSNFESTALL